MVYIFLHHRIDEIGDIPVMIDIFTYFRGADVLQLRGKLQFLHFSCDAIINLSRPGITGAAEDQMIKAVYGVFCRYFFIGAGIMDHVGAYYYVYILFGKNIPEFF